MSRFFAVLFVITLSCLAGAAYADDEAPARKLHVALTGSYSIRHKLVETFSFSPALSASANEKAEWSRKWSDWKSYASISYDILDKDRFLIRPVIHLGSSLGEFNATRAASAFSETWGTDPAFLWGASAVAELRKSRTSGPFVRAGYNFFEARSAEAWEEVINGGPNANPEERDARFEWQEHQASLAVGWRFGSLTPMAGAGYSWFSLKKWLSHHISEADASPEDLETIRALNSKESRYHYRSRAPLSPFLGVEWLVTPYLTVSAGAHITGDEEYSLNALWAF